MSRDGVRETSPGKAEVSGEFRRRLHDDRCRWGPIPWAIPRATASTRAASSGLALASIGVVYGDIGTSPLYALRESLAHSKSRGLTDEAVIGTVSLLIWALFFTVTAKYVLFPDARRQPR